MHKLTLKKEERLKRRKQIEHLFREGIAVNVFPYRVIYLLQAAHPGDVPLQAGFSASSRKFKKAVERNRIKRLTREGYRLQKKELFEKLLSSNRKMSLFFIYSGSGIPDFSTVKEKITVILNKLMQRLNEKDPADM
ncbi:MAG: ribonuclease P protein component [Chitinophagaceae bacterium]|nr:ribonuclease P protein component [Chitinophagaceae bacterium]MCW5926574.1 ribonuclease P protein component [Chitinophagaceae bacterium]